MFFAAAARAEVVSTDLHFSVRAPGGAAAPLYRGLNGSRKRRAEMYHNLLAGDPAPPTRWPPFGWKAPTDGPRRVTARVTKSIGLTQAGPGQTGFNA